MKKIFIGVMLSVLLIANSALAMTFSQPVKIGEIGFPLQAPYHGYIVNGATQNDGTAYTEKMTRDGKPIITYTQGLARFGDLYCKYNFENKNTDTINFGGKNDFVLSMNATFKKIFSIGNDSALKLYAIYYNYCVTDLKILGTRADGK